MRGGSRSPHYNAIDGLRTLAVAGVIVFHCFVPHLSGGFLGVDVFYVISGFVITLTLLREHDRDRHIDRGAFYLRRFFRLMPALLCMIAFGAVLEIASGAATAGAYGSDSAKAVTYTYNLFQALHDGRGTALSHTWSLGIEEQFYLVWAPLLAFVLARAAGTRRVKLATGLVVLFWASQVLTTATLGPTASFFLPWSRFDELLIGAVLALSVHQHPSTAVTRTLGKTPVVLVSLIALAAMVLAHPASFGHFLGYGGFVLAALLSAVLIGHLYVRNESRSPVYRAFAWSPLVWLGRRSYGIYLYHVPILLAIVHHYGWKICLPVTAIGATAVAAISYGLVERPLMRAGHAWLARRDHASAGTGSTATTTAT